MQMKGRTVVITGASQGLGFAVAEAFIKEGANIAICSRNDQDLQLAAERLRTLAGDSSQVLAEALDVSQEQAITAFIDAVASRFGSIDILIANAGVYGPKGPIEDVDWQDWCYTVDVNLKGSVLASRAVVPYFKKQGAGKMIFLSGGGATKPLPFLSAYAVSKVAVVRYAETLAEELKSSGIDINIVAPGALNTRLLDEAIAAGPEKIGETFYQQCLTQQQEGGASLHNAAALCVYLASSKSDGITGRLISAVWDPWQHLHEFKSELEASDVYTLRRIIPDDRGLNWEWISG